MRAVVQRVTSASVSVENDRIASIEKGLVILLGVGATDRAEDGERLAAKIAALRIFDDASGKMNHNVRDAGGALLVVPQFTLYGDIRHGRRPDFATAAPPETGRRLFDAFCGQLRGADLTVQAGRFGAHMKVELTGDGPVTIVATSDGWPEGEVRGG